jgi:Bacterial regulatory proteins, tetR family.
MAYPTKTDRDCILAVALEQVESGGVKHLAIRSVAAKLGLAPNALYRYFESLAALEQAVADEVRLQMLQTMQKAAGRKGPAETIRAISEAYLRFALEQPRLFLYTLKPSETAGQTPQCARNTEFFREQVTRLYGEKRALVVSHAILAYLRGLAASQQAGVLSKEQALASFKFGLQVWIDHALSSPKLR